jgi:hypothetical protein
MAPPGYTRRRSDPLGVGGGRGATDASCPWPCAMDSNSLLHASAPISSAPMAVPSPAAVPPSGTVGQLMPSAPPLESLRDTYTAASTSQFEDHGQPPSGGTQLGAADSSVASYSFFQPAELQVLQAQAVPVDGFQLAQGGAAPTQPMLLAQAAPMAQAMPVAQAVPVLTTVVGVPIFDPATVRSTAKTEQDSNDGVKSSDPCLSSVDEIFKFLNTCVHPCQQAALALGPGRVWFRTAFNISRHLLQVPADSYNTRPRVAARVHGYHRERRTRTVTRTDSEGRRREEREEYWVTVTDFDYKLDLTTFIFPFGFIQSVDDEGQDVAALIAAYLADDNMLKTLQMTVRQILVTTVSSSVLALPLLSQFFQMLWQLPTFGLWVRVQKEVSFDFNALGGMIHGCAPACKHRHLVALDSFSVRSEQTWLSPFSHASGLW